MAGIANLNPDSDSHQPQAVSKRKFEPEARCDYSGILHFGGSAHYLKLEIIRLVEQSSLSVRRTLAQLGIAGSTSYLWYERYLALGAGALEGMASRRRAASGTKSPAPVAEAVLKVALKQPELSPRVLATAFVDQQQYFVSEASVYRLLKAHDLITSPAFILMKAVDHFTQPTTAPNQLWQTDFQCAMMASSIR